MPKPYTNKQKTYGKKLNEKKNVQQRRKPGEGEKQTKDKVNLQVKNKHVENIKQKRIKTSNKNRVEGG